MLLKLEFVCLSLVNNSDINFEKVINIVIGYEMQDNLDYNYIEVQINSEFVLCWYVEYDGEWYVYNDGRFE